MGKALQEHVELGLVGLFTILVFAKMAFLLINVPS